MEAFELLTYKGARQLFGTLRAFPQRQFTINELAKTARLPFTTTWKLVQKFERASIVEVALVGKSRAVKYRKSPFSGVIEGILRLSVSHQALSIPALRRLLKAKTGISSAYLFGSVASGQERLESDVDVALLIKRKIDTSSFMSGIYEKYGVKVVPVMFDSKDEFNDFLDGKKKVRLV
ncbi:MAG: nucleotidyltransferase domain-containing protein [Candidatus Micrarchaeia archaeon]